MVILGRRGGRPSALIARLPDDAEDRSDDERGRWLLAQLLNWHRREAKSFWWRHFYLREELTDEERRDESDALGELTFERDWRDPAPRARSTIYRFRFPPQEHRIRVGGQPYDPATGQVAATVFEVGEDHIGPETRLWQTGTDADLPHSRLPSARSRSPRACNALHSGQLSTASTPPVSTARRATC